MKDPFGHTHCSVLRVKLGDFNVPNHLSIKVGVGALFPPPPSALCLVSPPNNVHFNLSYALLKKAGDLRVLK